MRMYGFLSMLMLLFALAASACQAGSPNLANPAQANTGQMNEATFIATEYAYQGPQSLPGGWSRLILDNQGKLPHDLILIKLSDGKTAADVMAALEAGAPPEWAQIYGNVSAEPGQSRAYLVNLTPGNYVLLSFGQAQDGPPDAAQGMISNLTVTEAQSEVAEASLPQADAEIGLIDFFFVIKGQLNAGEQTLRVNNTGKELHEVVVYRLKQGKTMEDFQMMLEMEMTGQAGSPDALPVEEVGAAFMSPGVSTFVTMKFEPGNYVFICHIPSPANEMKPHYAMGMIQQVTVK